MEEDINMLFRISVIWLGSFAMLTAMIGMAVDAPHLIAMLGEQGTATGRLEEYIPNSHGQLRVSYGVGGRAYAVSALRPSYFTSIPTGGAVAVYYWRQDPSVAFLEPAERILSEEWPVGLGAALTMSTIIAVTLSLYFRKSVGPQLMWRPSPRFVSGGLLVGALGGLVLAAARGTLRPNSLLASILVVFGCGIFILASWNGGPSWREIVRARAFWIAVAVIAVGNVLGMIVTW